MVGGILPGIRSKLSQRAFSSLRRLAVHACIFIDFPRVRVGWRSPVTLHDGHPEPPRTSSSPVRFGFLRSLRAQLRAAPARASQSLSSIASVRVGFRTFGVSVRACSVVSRGCEQHNKKTLPTHTHSHTSHCWSENSFVRIFFVSSFPGVQCARFSSVSVIQMERNCVIDDAHTKVLLFGVTHSGACV